MSLDETKLWLLNKVKYRLRRATLVPNVWLNNARFTYAIFPIAYDEERQRRNSVRSPRSRSGSDVIGRSPSSMSISSTDSHDSWGTPVAHGRTASWSSPQSSQVCRSSPLLQISSFLTRKARYSG